MSRLHSYLFRFPLGRWLFAVLGIRRPRGFIVGVTRPGEQFEPQRRA